MTTTSFPLPPVRVPNITGNQYGRWTVLGYSHTANRKNYWHCRCSCNAESVVEKYQLTAGHSVSCGCLRVERTAETNRTHNLSKNPIYKCWSGMVSRCHNPADPSYNSYGEKGIAVCDRWRFGENGLHPLTCFFQDLGERPSMKHTIDRINNQGNYEPGNVRWATHTEQVNNRECTQRIEWNGQIRSLSEWATSLHFDYKLLRNRLDAGWTPERAFTTPVALVQNTARG